MPKPLSIDLREPNVGAVAATIRNANVPDEQFVSGQ